MRSNLFNTAFAHFCADSAARSGVSQVWLGFMMFINKWFLLECRNVIDFASLRLLKKLAPLYHPIPEVSSFLNPGALMYSITVYLIKSFVIYLTVLYQPARADVSKYDNL